jgi:CheY-like chemotaxis protein
MRPILVVEDDPTIRTLIHDVLAEEGFAVIGAEDGARALAMLDEQPAALILLDLYMPNVNGWQFLDALRKRPDSAIPVVICSAVAPKQLPSGVVAALKKPFSLQALLAAVTPLVSRDAVAESEVRRPT